MKFIVTVLFLSLFATGFGQGTLEESGTWCDGDLEITAPLTDGSTVLGWYKDGVLLTGETSPSINCTAYGKGLYSVKVNASGEELTIEHDLTGIEGPSSNFTAKNMLAAAVTYFEDSSISTEEITAWHWDFGNGETSSEQNPKVMFAEQKVYTITLKVTTTSGCTHTITKKHEWAYK
ncbi:MAG: hypothetical protein ACI8ZM_002147 [Crocinitomix sp.]|jgi:hypothetical protein